MTDKDMATKLALDLANMLTHFQKLAGVPIPVDLERVEIMRTILNWMGQPQPVRERALDEEYKFKVVLGHLAFGNSVYDLVDQFLGSNAAIERRYQELVKELKDDARFPDDTAGRDGMADEIESFYEIGNNLADRQNSVIYG